MATRPAMPHRHRHPPDGFTLVEIVVGLALAALVVALGLPVYRDVIAARELDNQARRLADTLNRARSEAIKHGYRVNVCKSANGRDCAVAGAWDMGYLVYTEDDGDGRVDADETRVRAEGPARNGITIRGNRPVADFVSYTALGHARLLSGALQMGTFTVCRPGHKALEVILANSGRVRIDRTARPCP